MPDSTVDLLAVNQFTVGQRWLSETETELGLGIIQSTDYRLVTIFFPFSEEERIYAKDNAPLSRVVFKVGDTISLFDDSQFQVTALKESGGVLIYSASNQNEQRDIPETQLAHQLNLALASDRLFSKQIDKPKWFELRHETFSALAALQRSQCQGLIGPRVELIPHQLHIAEEVSNRYAPRVLLSDEVGLGKTIEAGLIIHQQIRTHRAQRVLIVVPEALVHQWFVEMYRRFNLAFSIFDHERIAALTENDSELELDVNLELETDLDSDFTGINPFLTEQLILCSTAFVTECQLADLLDAEWDLLVVDEAHHLEWQEDKPSHAYSCIESLAHSIPSVLLLTATPEQLGIHSHFARLQLLDPQRFSSLKQFIEEQDHYQEIAELARAIIDQQSSLDWSSELINKIAAQISDIEITPQNSDAIIERLIDRSGTSRIMFRNTRKNISGFPSRNTQLYPLPLPKQYQSKNSISLTPEASFDDDSWCQYDPRIDWLTDFLKQNSKEKILVICARKETAMDMQAWISYKQGLRIAVFHEDMDIISRDRAAAYFSESYDGAQALVCSEIGSEGRNFQFAQHLVLFDLPLNPDLLEQRIGRLDRIGQQSNIYIHVPYFEEHTQAVLAQWYDQGLNAFNKINPAAVHIAEQYHDTLNSLLEQENGTALDEFIQQSQQQSQQLNQQLESGRDCLLELSSNNPDKAERIRTEIQHWDENTPFTLLENIFDRFGVESEAHDEHSWVYKPGDHMLNETFPNLPEDGLTAVYSRQHALSRDDMHFLSWEHPLVTGAMELVTSQNKGKASMCLLQNKSVKPGTLLVESLYVIQAQGPKQLQTQRFLPLTLLRILSDINGNNIADKVSHTILNQQCQKMEKHLAKKIIDSQQSLLQGILDKAAKQVEQQSESIIQIALEKMQKEQESEAQRLNALQAINPNIRPEEVAYIKEQTLLLTNNIQHAKFQLDAVRVIVAS